MSFANCLKSRKLCENNDCEICFKKSFKSNEKHKFISDVGIDARNILKNSNKKITFNLHNMQT